MKDEADVDKVFILKSLEKLATLPLILYDS